MAERERAREERLRALEERMARLEERSGGEPVVTGDFWALEALKARVTEERGAVLFTGTVTLPTEEHYEWQEGFDAGTVLEEDWTGSADRLAALAHPVRLLLLREILSGTRTVAELGEHPALGTAGQLYHHLRQLTSAGWVKAAGRGRYAVPPVRVVPLLVILVAAGGR